MTTSSNLTIGIQGDVGSFSEQAASTFLERAHITDFTLNYLITSERVTYAVQQGTIDYGLLAIENAQGGVVIETVKAIAEHRCHIADMFQIRVEQNLLTLPGVTAGDITAIYSHQQALRQCRQYLAEHFWGCTLVEHDDTATAAQALRNGSLPPTAAVIANEKCAELYSLDIFAKSIQDLKNNLTMFLAINKPADA